MATIRNLEQSEKVIFTKVGTLLKQLRDIPNARSTFSIENGIEYYTNAELGKALIRAAKKSPSFSGNQASKQIESLANVLEKCKKNLQACEEIIGRAMQINSWTLELEEEMSDSWRMFSITFSDASTMLESGELDLLMLLGKPESSTVGKRETVIWKVYAEQLAEQET